MKVRIPMAVFDKIVVKELPQDEMTSGGIVMPETAVKAPQLNCEVLSIGAEIKPELEHLKVGDVILCHPNGGMAIMVDSVIMRVLKYDEIYAILPPKEE
jgi:chaperonin GroES